MQQPEPGKQVVVVGLGRFESAVTAELVRLGFELLGIGGDGTPVQSTADTLTHAVQADATSEEALGQLGQRLQLRRCQNRQRH